MNYPAQGRLAVMYSESVEPVVSPGGGLHLPRWELLGYLVTINDETGWGVVLTTRGGLTNLETLRGDCPDGYELTIQHV